MSLMKEFREFAVKGNMVDMAVGIIIGAAFGKVVSSLVADVLMPPLGVIIGGVDFTGLQLTLKHAVDSSPAVTLRYGAFIQQVFDFLIVALAMFLMVKAMNRLRNMMEVEKARESAPPRQEQLLAEIRDLLKNRP